MARKSNKTAHVLNLLAGHDAHPAADETPDTKPSAEPEKASEAASQEQPAPADTKAAASTASVQNISVIDKTGKDPVADLIQRNLSAQFEGTMGNTPVEDADTAMPGSLETADNAAISDNLDAADADTPSVTEEPDTAEAADNQLSTDKGMESISDSSAADTMATAEDSSISDTTAESSVPNDTSSVNVPPPEPLPAPAPISVPSPEPLPSIPVPDPESIPGPGPTTVPKETPEPESEPVPEPEPDFVYLNIMEAIVKDKIIYYMRQFDVCTCERCVADTIALTMNGLTPRYIVTPPAAVDPLIGFYTNKLISDITVEATKACITVKDNPRH